MENTIKPQRLFWGVNHGMPPGAIVGELGSEFIPWDVLKEELQARVSECSQITEKNARVRLNDLDGKKDWVIEIVDPVDTVIGSIWIGGDPENEWAQDGLVRIGKAHSRTSHEVYQVMQRWSDGSYVSVLSSK